MANSDIPVIDFKQYGILQDPSKVEDQELETLAKTMCDAFRNIGFVYLINHGIDDKKVESIFNVSMDFFCLPEEVKSKCAKRSDEYSGWVPLYAERVNPERKAGDLKETFNLCPHLDDVHKWPSDPEGFREIFLKFFRDCTQLTFRVLDVLSLGLKLNRRTFLRDCHSFIGQPGNITCIRSSYYPEIPKTDLPPDQTRCGEHTDYGSVTLLFQDNTGGLEVENKDGAFIPATPVPGSVVVNLGDLMQRWTGDKLIATKHRVIIPEGECRRKRPRQSVAFFVVPNDHTMIECLDGSNKYPPVTARDNLLSKVDAQYGQ